MSAVKIGPRRVTLVGCMGSGKTTLSRILAARWQWTAWDLDDAIVDRANRTLNAPDKGELSISDIFAHFGETTFRQLEQTCLADALTQVDHVIATGGGAPAQQGAMDAMINAGPTIWLHGDPAVLFERAYNQGGRPLIAGASLEESRTRFEAIAEKRRPYYAKARLKVDVSSSGPEQIADTIEKTLRDIEEGPCTH